ncbi:hypothetical protein Dshi_0384 [Dinoroseobacter shibae DFL 12 = DSM 16493]|uniref:NUDIX hydrolase n=1 Tax=Dinoroseobacter shibae (strain DSM 16493 / NCIMB 14021 / DFL 12) TaxID=398580 RepID=A8LMY9_DINSH|nr:hypothetical protein [Dinoroseobacter shibae]ABV92133.1 hypothetical protein Dshi_0384 [Dinoroseobacter shibae DFL 12 = DSM 16493]URF47091.1 hypothetical protein M8008_01955 [Dinoroseobacter shibae]URF51402.1 hypothetical protein M8007_01955 [Dinoroseobacter shibae]
MPQQNRNTDFQGVTLAALHADKVAVTCLPPKARPDAGGPVWTLPQLDRTDGESPADTALRLVRQTLGFPLPVTRLNWPILRLAETDAPDPRPDWFFAAWLSPMEWEVLSRDGGPRDALMLSIESYLKAPTAIAAQQDSLRHYLRQKKRAPGA